MVPEFYPQAFQLCFIHGWKLRIRVGSEGEYLFVSKLFVWIFLEYICIYVYYISRELYDIHIYIYNIYKMMRMQRRHNIIVSAWLHFADFLGCLSQRALDNPSNSKTARRWNLIKGSAGVGDWMTMVAWWVIFGIGTPESQSKWPEKLVLVLVEDLIIEHMCFVFNVYNMILFDLIWHDSCIIAKYTSYIYIHRCW